MTGSALAGIAAIATATGVRRRRDFYRPMILIALAYALAIAAMGLVDGALGSVLLRRAIWGVAAGFASVLDRDAPPADLGDDLLGHDRHHAARAGRPQSPHSQAAHARGARDVPPHPRGGSLAEAGAAAIGGNPLLGRIGAYYHDIGKIEKAEYYVENQSSARSRHEKLSPTMSCLIIEAHVREGAEIARKERLPRAIVDAIL